MRFTAITGKSTRVRWTLASVVFVAGLFAGIALRSLPDARTDKPRTVEQLIRDLREQDTVLDRCWQALWPKLPSAARKRLLNFEPKPAVLVRREACEALSDLPTKTAKAVPALIVALNDSDPHVQLGAIHALGSMGPLASDAQPDLLRIFKGRQTPKHARAAAVLPGDAGVALAHIAPADSLVFQLLKGALDERDASGKPSDLTFAAVSGLEKMAGARDDIVSTLLAVLPQADAHLRSRILSAFGRIGQQPEIVVPLLVEALSSEDWSVRSAAVESLDSFGAAAAPAVPALIRLAQAALAQLRNRAQTALAQLKDRLRASSDQDDAPDLRDPQRVLLYVRYGLLPEIDPMSSRLLRTLGRIGHPAMEAIPFLIEEYSQQENPARYEAAFARWQIDGNAEAVFPVLLESIRHPIFRTRSSMIPFLREMGPQAVPVLVAAFRDTDRTGRATAIECLAEIQPTALLDRGVLESGIKDPSVSVRIALIRGLGECGEKAAAAVPLLKPLLNDPKYVIRKVAAEALGKIAPAQAGNLSPRDAVP